MAESFTTRLIQRLQIEQKKRPIPCNKQTIGPLDSLKMNG